MKGNEISNWNKKPKPIYIMVVGSCCHWFDYLGDW